MEAGLLADGLGSAGPRLYRGAGDSSGGKWIIFMLWYGIVSSKTTALLLKGIRSWPENTNLGHPKFHIPWAFLNDDHMGLLLGLGLKTGLQVDLKQNVVFQNLSFA